MHHPKQHIIDLAEICQRNKVAYIIISPGSRNAPLIDAFYSTFKDRCLSIVDERSAGYFALGISRYLNLPVAMVSTSGTAMLNYSPALAEAYYQKVPLLAITADRPAEWVDQQDNQAIRQQGVYKNFVRQSFCLPQNMDAEENLSIAQNIIKEAITCALCPPGPVHINVPLYEPLYDPLPNASENITNISIDRKTYSSTISADFENAWKNAAKIMIVHGHDIPCPALSGSLRKLASDPRVVIIAENIANIDRKFVIADPDLLLAHNSMDQYSPDLLIYSGGQVVSKKLKDYLRQSSFKNCWRVGLDDLTIDTFRNLAGVENIPAESFYDQLVKLDQYSGQSDYRKEWSSAQVKVHEKRDQILLLAPFSDLKVFEILSRSVPEDCILELGNSSVVRYSQLLTFNSAGPFYSNRGVSGIDGCLSAASGTAYVSDRLTLSIIGDLSFVYDSNALWNNKLSKKLRIVVINNSGGGIFHLIEGPSKKESFTKFFEAHHRVHLKKLAEAFELEYFYAENEKDFIKKLSDFFSESERAAIFEVKTNSSLNTKWYKIIMGKTELSIDPE